MSAAFEVWVPPGVAWLVTIAGWTAAVRAGSPGWLFLLAAGDAVVAIWTLVAARATFGPPWLRAAAVIAAILLLLAAVALAGLAMIIQGLSQLTF